MFRSIKKALINFGVDIIVNNALAQFRHNRDSMIDFLLDILMQYVSLADLKRLLGFEAQDDATVKKLAYQLAKAILEGLHRAILNNAKLIADKVIEKIKL